MPVKWHNIDDGLVLDLSMGLLFNKDLCEPHITGVKR